MFSCIEDTTGTETETGHALRGSAKVGNNKAIRESLSTVLTNKAAVQTRDPMLQNLAIEDGDVQGGVPKKRKTTKQPREATEEEKKQKEFDPSMKKILFYIVIQICLSQVLSFHL